LAPEEIKLDAGFVTRPTNPAAPSTLLPHLQRAGVTLGKAENVAFVYNNEFVEPREPCILVILASGI